MCQLTSEVILIEKVLPLTVDITEVTTAFAPLTFALVNKRISLL